jgi:hypothetical protein
VPRSLSQVASGGLSGSGGLFSFRAYLIET